MAADRGIDAAGLAKALGAHDLAVQRLAHAVEPLELVRAIPGKRGYGGNGVGIVGRELRIEAVGPRQQRPRRGEIGDIGIHLAGEHGIPGEPGLLRPFDLAVPIGALDQPHGDAPARRLCHDSKPVDQRQRALAVSLHGEPEPVPFGKLRIGE